MPTPLEQKSTAADIARRFDADVERFSNLETGQKATIDAPLVMELITAAAMASTPRIRRVLDIGCGAGNNALKLLQASGHDFDIALIDLSRPMLERAQARISAVSHGTISLYHGDFREAPLEEGAYDIVLAAAVLHHLREDADWEAVFAKIYLVTAPGGSVWVTDLVAHETDAVQQLMWNRYGDYLTSVGGEEYRERVFEYVDKEDSPRPVTYQLDLLRHVGFTKVELLHKNSCFVAFGAVKAK